MFLRWIDAHKQLGQCGMHMGSLGLVLSVLRKSLSHDGRYRQTSETRARQPMLRQGTPINDNLGKFNAASKLVHSDPHLELLPEERHKARDAYLIRIALRARVERRTGSSSFQLLLLIVHRASFLRR